MYPHNSVYCFIRGWRQRRHAHAIGRQMRFMLKASIPVDTGNASAKQGYKVLPEILEQLKPEAVYFYAEQGKRTALLILDLADASQIPAVSEPFFLAMNAAVEIYPVMIPEDLQKAVPAVAKAVEKYG